VGMSRKPMFDRFNTFNGNSYIYDAQTGTVMPDNGILYDVLKLYHEKKEVEISDLDKLSKDNERVKSTAIFVKRWTDKYEGFFENNV
jgi:hypothetical protein